MVVPGAPCFSFPGRTRRSIFAFHCGIIYFYSRVLTVQGKELSGGLHGQRGVVRCGLLCLLVNKIEFRILKREVAGGWQKVRVTTVMSCSHSKQEPREVGIPRWALRATGVPWFCQQQYRFDATKSHVLTAYFIRDRW